MDSDSTVPPSSSSLFGFPRNELETLVKELQSYHPHESTLQAARFIQTVLNQTQQGERLPQSEGADFFVILDKENNVQEAYNADLGRAFGQEFINEAIDSQEEGAENWKIRPVYSSPQDECTDEDSAPYSTSVTVLNGGSSLKEQEMRLRICNLVDSLLSLRYCLSYNESYFDEPPGVLKTLVADMDRRITRNEIREVLAAPTTTTDSGETK